MGTGAQGLRGSERKTTRPRWNGEPGIEERGSNVKRDLDILVAQMHAGGITYDEAVREFKRRFILEVLAGQKGNQCKAAKELGVHRNTLSRILAELEIDPTQVRNGLKRPPRSERGLFGVKESVR